MLLMTLHLMDMTWYTLLNNIPHGTDTLQAVQNIHPNTL